MPMSEFRAANQLTWVASNKAVSILKAEKPRGAGLATQPVLQYAILVRLGRELCIRCRFR